MNVGELIDKLTGLGPEAMELPVVYVDEVWAVTIDELQIVETDETGSTTGDSSYYFRDSGYSNQKVVVVL